MKKYWALSWIVVGMVVFSACEKKKDEAKVAEAASVAVVTPEGVVTPQTAENPSAPSVNVRTLTPDERAAKLGFARYLPQDVEAIITLPNLSKTVKAVKGSDFFKVMEGEMDSDMGEGDGDEAMEEADEAESEGNLYDREITLAFGKSTSEQSAHSLILNRARTRLMMRGMANGMSEIATSGSPADFMQTMAMGSGPEMFRELLADPETGVALLEKLAMPPLYIAFRVIPDGAEATAQQLTGVTEMIGGMLGDMVEVTEVEKAGQTFSGYTVLGEKAADSLEGLRPMMEQMADETTTDRLIAAVGKKNLVVLTGMIGDYAVLFIGSSVDDLLLAPSAGESILAGEPLAFFDAHADKELAAVIYGRKDLIQNISDAAGGLSDIADGLREGFAEAEGLGDTRDIEALLRIVSERESALLKLTSSDATGTVAFLEDGLKIESYGGSDSGAINWDAPNRLSHLGAGENTVMFSNMSGDAAYAVKMRSYFEVLIETGYAMSMKFSEIADDGSLEEMKKMTQLFDGGLREDVVALWEAFNGDFNAGLGVESAVVVDLVGSAPAIPKVPQELLDEAKFPRISMIAPVANRAKLASAWESMGGSANRIAAKIGKMNGMEIPEQKPMTSEKNGFTTWFLPLPFFNDDFLPSVTLNDEWFALSSSKNQVHDLLAMVEKKEAVTTGMHFMMNFEALRVFIDHSSQLIAKHPDALPMDEEDLDALRKLSAATKGLEKLSVHYRRENGLLRGSTHFKTR